MDTSVWSLALRRAPHHRSRQEAVIVGELAELIHEGRARIIGIIRQELLSGIKVQQQFEKLREILRAFPDEALDSADYEAGALASNQCRGKGLAVSVSDMLTCAVSQSREWPIFSTDPDFGRYARILRIQLHAVRK